MAKFAAVVIPFFLMVAWFNPGFIAVDDYASNIEIIVPAQSTNFSTIVAASDFRPPFANLAFYSITRLAQILGVEHPETQLAILRCLIALVGLGLFALSTCKLSDGGNLDSAIFLGLFFLSPLLFTRVLIEGVSAPWLLASAALASAYWRTGLRRELLFSLACLSIATLFRYQNGVVLPALLLTVILRRDWRGRWRDLLVVGFMSLAIFSMVGLADLWLKGHFHGSLQSYVAYNFAHSSSYGVSPVYSYPALFGVFCIPFIILGRGINWASAYRGRVPVFLFFAFFLIAHSLVPHKEERFMIPILPIFIILLMPLWHHAKQMARILPLNFLIGLNGLFLVTISFNTPQRNVIGIAEYLNGHPEIRTLYGISDTLAVFPRAYLARPVTELRTESFVRVTPDCFTLIACRSDLLNNLSHEGFEVVAVTRPGLTESLVIRLNPKRNSRRGPIQLFRVRGCADASSGDVSLRQQWNF